MKFGVKSYWKPTPIVMKKIGDSMLAASLAITSFSLATDAGNTVTIVIACIGVVGKFLSNFFAQDEK